MNYAMNEALRRIYSIEALAQRDEPTHITSTVVYIGIYSYIYIYNLSIYIYIFIRRCEVYIDG